MKKIISALLSICVMISMFAGTGLTAFADEAQTAGATEIWFCGEKLNAEKPYLIIGKISDDDTATSVVEACTDINSSRLYRTATLAVFDANENSLTFEKGYSNPPQYDKWEPRIRLKQIDSETDKTFYGIYAKGNLTINLGKYANVLFLDRQKEELKKYAQEGIHVEGDLTVNGEDGGMLRVTANPSGKKDGGLNSYGVNVSGKVTLNGGLIDVYENTYNIEDPYNINKNYYLIDNYATFIKAGNVELNGGSLFLRGRKSDASPANKKKLHEIGAENADAINVPAAYEQAWADTAEYVGGSTDPENYDKMMGNDINNSFAAEKTDGDIYVKYYTASEGYRIKVMGIEIGGKEKYLVKEGDSFKASETAENAVAEYIVTAPNGEGTYVRELKFLQDCSFEKTGDGIVYTIESNSNLTLNTNGKNVKLTAAANYVWPVTRGNCVHAKGEVVITGGGKLEAIIGAGRAEEGSSSDKSVSAVIYSGSKIKLDDITATLYLGDEKSSGFQANVLYAPEVEITENANIKMAKTQPPKGSTPGYIIGGAASAEKISIAPAADAFLGSSRSQWGQPVLPSKRLSAYSYDAMKEATYMEVETRDKTVAVNMIAVNDDNVVKADSNEVKFIVSPFEASDNDTPNVFVVAAVYDENNKLITADTYSGAADAAEHKLTVGGGDSIRVYVWNKADVLKPLKKVRIFYSADLKQ